MCTFDFKLIETFVAMKTPQTRRAYLAAVARLAEFFETTERSIEFCERIQQMGATHAAAFSVWLRTRTTKNGQCLADATISQRIHLLRRLFRFLVAVEAIPRNSFDAIIDDLPRRQRRQKRPTKLIPRDAIAKMLQMPDRRTRDGVRDYCLLSLLFGGGLRRSEAYHLNVDDVVISQKGTLSLIIKHAKAGSVQTQSLPEWAAEAFSQLVSQRIGEGAQPGHPLFVFYHVNGFVRGRISVETIRRIYQRYTEQVGLGKVSPHSARASAATYLLEEGCSEISVANFLRHCDEQQVRIYDKRARTAETNPGLRLRYTLDTNEEPDIE